MNDFPAILTSSSAVQLQNAALAHNWDDGYELPITISAHPNCDLGVAMLLFWLADGPYWYTRGPRPIERLEAWSDFCSSLSQRILNGTYEVNLSSFQSNIGAALKAKLKSQGVPAVFLSDVNGREPAPDW